MNHSARFFRSASHAVAVISLAIIAAACATAISPVATATQSTPPTPTLAPTGWPDVLSAYPLVQGAAWEYHVAIDYADSNAEAHQWEGPITETVVTATPAIENWVFHMALTGDTSHTWRSVDQYFVARGGGLYAFSQAKQAMDATNPATPAPAVNQILAWPLQDGQRFGSSDLKYIWFVNQAEAMDVPAGHFDNCFTIEIVTNPDDAHYWFCAGVGFVRYEYRHHGTLQNEVWELTSFKPGS